jgi:hypothetical protein
MASLKDIPSASSLRCIQQANADDRGKETAGRNEQFVKSFSAACDKYFDNIISEAINVIKRSKHTTKTSAILDATNLTCNVDGFTYAKLLYGSWNRNTRKFDENIFAECNIERPFDRAVTELAKLGYKLENISDSSKSFSLFIRLSW